MPKLKWKHDDGVFASATHGYFQLWLGQNNGCWWYGITRPDLECANCFFEEDSTYILDHTTDMPTNQGDIVDHMAACEAMLCRWLLKMAAGLNAS